MKMKRVKVELTIECPANRNWTDYVSISGGQTVKSSTKIIEEADLGDIDPPWGQKMREMYTIRKVIAEALKASLSGFPDLIITVQGSTNYGSAGFVYYPSFCSKLYGYDESKLPKQVKAIRGITWTFEPGGALIWEFERGGHPRKVATMNVGDPEVGTKIKDQLLKLYDK